MVMVVVVMVVVLRGHVVKHIVPSLLFVAQDVLQLTTSHTSCSCRLVLCFFWLPLGTQLCQDAALAHSPVLQKHLLVCCFLIKASNKKPIRICFSSCLSLSVAFLVRLLKSIRVCLSSCLSLSVAFLVRLLMIN